jgi:hypothetical protein
MPGVRQRNGMVKKYSRPSQSYSDDFLGKYLEEHLWYEIDMLFGIGKYLSVSTAVCGPTPDDARRINNVLIEGFGLHLRNVIDFLFLDRPEPTDVVASDFCNPGAWENLRPLIGPALTRARTRSNKELAHLTTSRIAGAVPEKNWDAVALLKELKPTLKLWLEKAKPSTLSTRIKELIDSL